MELPVEDAARGGLREVIETTFLKPPVSILGLPSSSKVVAPRTDKDMGLSAAMIHQLSDLVYL